MERVLAVFFLIQGGNPFFWLDIPRCGKGRALGTDEVGVVDMGKHRNWVAASGWMVRLPRVGFLCVCL